MSSGGEAVVHEGVADLATALGPVLRAGLLRGDDVVLSCAADRAAALAGAAGNDPRLRILPPRAAWRRPVPAVAACLGLAESAAAAGRGLVLVSDSEFGTDPVGGSEWARYEAASHAVTAGYPVRRFCLLDGDEAPADVVATAERLHPVVRRGGTAVPSATYTAPAESVPRDAYVSTDPTELAPPTLTLDEVAGAGDLPPLRHALAAEVGRQVLPDWQAYEFVLAVGEVAANAVRHGRPPVRVRFWAEPRRLLVTVTDLGAGFDFPLSCYLAPDPAAPGLGLYLARQLVDQMNVRWTPDGFTVRLGMLLGAA